MTADILIRCSFNREVEYMKKIGLKKLKIKVRFLCLSALIIFLLPSILLGQILFENKATQAGIDHFYDVPGIAGGVSFFDFDDDGWDDITLASEKGQPIAFYKNNNGIFQKLSPLVDHEEESKQVLWVDFDNDGDKDLYVATFDGANRLYKNTGNLNLVDITFESGLPLDEHRTFGACWGDYNRDGWLDLYYGERKFPIGVIPNENRLFLNNADGTFTEKTLSSGTQDPGRIPFCSSFLDYNNDGWPDIYTANDRRARNTLLRNKGNGTFVDVSNISRSGIRMEAMCVAVGDYDHNGWSDIYITDIPDGNTLLQNQGEALVFGEIVFEDKAEEAGVGFYGNGWGANFLDGDNDGDLDLYVCASPSGDATVTSKFYVNENLDSFSELSVGFAGDTVMSYSNAVGDYNQDGFPDIIVQNNSDAKAQLWRNQEGPNNWLGVKLQGVLSNRDGIGTKMEIYSGGRYQMRYTHCGIGFMGQNSSVELIGLADLFVVDSIRISWPTGHVDLLENINANQRILIVEGSTTEGEIYVASDVNIVTVDAKDILASQVEVEIYPNPSASILHIKTNYAGFRQFMVIDAQGKKLLEGNFENVIEVNHFTEGIYFLVLFNSKGERVVKKWVKGY